MTSTRLSTLPARSPLQTTAAAASSPARPQARCNHRRKAAFPPATLTQCAELQDDDNGDKETPETTFVKGMKFLETMKAAKDKT